MKFKQFAALILLVALPWLTRAQKNQKTQKVTRESCTPETPPVIDGDLRDWQAEWQLDPKGKFIYNICNDATNLYVRLKVTDDMTQRKIGLFGLTVFLNPNSKKIGKMGLKYPVEKTLEEIKKSTPSGPMDAKQLADIKRKLIEDQEVLEFVGFAKEPVVSSRLGLMNGIQVIIKTDSIGDYVYEAKIPFKAFHIDKNSLKTLDVAFVTGKLVTPKGSQSGPQQQGIGYGNSNYGRGYNPGSYGRYGGNYGGMYNQPTYTPLQSYTPFAQSTYLSVLVKLK
jgi:hypothetical protein